MQHFLTKREGIWYWFRRHSFLFLWLLNVFLLAASKLQRKYTDCQFFTISPEGLTTSFMISRKFLIFQQWLSSMKVGPEGNSNNDTHLVQRVKYHTNKLMEALMIKKTKIPSPPMAAASLLGPDLVWSICAMRMRALAGRAADRLIQTPARWVWTLARLPYRDSSEENLYPHHFDVHVDFPETW